MGGDSRPKGRGFESRYWILDGHFLTFICCKICNSVGKDENKWKRGRDWPIFKKKILWLEDTHHREKYLRHHNIITSLLVSSTGACALFVCITISVQFIIWSLNSISFRFLSGQVVQGEHGAEQQLQDPDGGEGVDPPAHAHHPRPVVTARLRQLLVQGGEPSGKGQSLHFYLR